MDAARLFENGDESLFASHIGRCSPNAIIAVIDDDYSCRKSFVRLIRAGNYEPKTFASASEFLESPVLEVASCVITELIMPGLTGLQLQQLLHSKMPSLSMIFISAHADVTSAVTAIKAGAIDLFEKPVRQGALLEAIGCAVGRTNKWRAAMAEIAKLNIQYDRLTPREREVFALLSAGLLNKQVAAQLGAAEKTVKQHRGTIMRKMEAESFADLVLMAERIGVRPRDANFAEAKGRLSPRYVNSQSLELSVASSYRSVGAAFGHANA